MSHGGGWRSRRLCPRTGHGLLRHCPCVPSTLSPLYSESPVIPCGQPRPCSVISGPSTPATKRQKATPRRRPANGIAGFFFLMPKVFPGRSGVCRSQAWPPARHGAAVFPPRAPSIESKPTVKDGSLRPGMKPSHRSESRRPIHRSFGRWSSRTHVRYQGGFAWPDLLPVPGPSSA